MIVSSCKVERYGNINVDIVRHNHSNLGLDLFDGYTNRTTYPTCIG